MHIGWFIRNLTNTIVFKKKISKGQFVVVLIFGYMYIMQKRLYIYFMYTFSKCHQDATKWHKCHICGILFSWFPWRLRASDHKKTTIDFLYHKLRRGCGLWINNFTFQNCVRKIFISRQQKKYRKYLSAKRTVWSIAFYTCKTKYMFFH